MLKNGRLSVMIRASSEHPPAIFREIFSTFDPAIVQKILNTILLWENFFMALSAG